MALINKKLVLERERHKKEPSLLELHALCFSKQRHFVKQSFRENAYWNSAALTNEVKTCELRPISLVNISKKSFSLKVIFFGKNLTLIQASLITFLVHALTVSNVFILQNGNNLIANTVNCVKLASNLVEIHFLIFIK